MCKGAVSNGIHDAPVVFGRDIQLLRQRALVADHCVGTVHLVVLPAVVVCEQQTVAVVRIGGARIYRKRRQHHRQYHTQDERSFDLGLFHDLSSLSLDDLVNFCIA